jgi:hypothetical protein
LWFGEILNIEDFWINKNWQQCQKVKNYFFVFLFFIAIWCVIAFFGLFGGQHQAFIDWVKQNGTDDWYNYPAMKYIGQVGYPIFGDAFFLVFPFCLFAGSIIFLLAICNEFGFSPIAFAGIFLTVSAGFNSIGFFTHDSPIFLLGSAFAYFYFLALYKNKNTFLQLFAIAFLSLWFRESGFIFCFLAIVVFVGTWLKKQYYEDGSPMFYGLFPLALLNKTIQDNLFALKEGNFFAKVVSPFGFLRYFNNAIFSFSFVAYFLKRDNWHLLLIIITFFYVYSVAVHSIFNDAVYRYTYSLVPLHLFYVQRILSGGIKK